MRTGDLMLDLETLGVGPFAVVVSIGAVYFDPKTGLGEEKYLVLDIDEQVRRTRVIDPGTVKWWLQQTEQARDVFKQAPTPVLKALSDFSDFVNPEARVRVWGNGSDFDNIILGSLYDAFGVKKPWSYSNNRCYRTLKNCAVMKDSHAVPEFEGVAHNALADARYQAECAVRYLNGQLKK